MHFHLVTTTIFLRDDKEAADAALPPSFAG